MEAEKKNEEGEKEELKPLGEEQHCNGGGEEGSGGAAKDVTGDSWGASGPGQTVENWSPTNNRRASPEPSAPYTEPPETPSKTPSKGRGHFQHPGKESGTSSERRNSNSETPPTAAANVLGSTPTAFRSPTTEQGEVAVQHGGPEVNPILRQVVSAFSPVRSPAKMAGGDGDGAMTPRTESYQGRWGTVRSVIGSPISDLPDETSMSDNSGDSSSDDLQ